jgi:hypothetical protein
MKRQRTEWEKILVNISDKGLISKICKELIELISKKKKKKKKQKKKKKKELYRKGERLFLEKAFT